MADRPANLTDNEVSKIKDSFIESDKTFQAGQIKNFVDEWENITSDRWIIDTVLGAKIEFEDISNLPISMQKHNKQLSSIEEVLFRKEIARLRNRDVIKPIKESEAAFISSIFLREKKDNQYRLILNLKNFNRYVKYRHFKMDNLNAALGMVRQNCYMASIDLADAYYTVPVALSDQKYLVFNFEGQLYKYVCLPNGLSSAPRIFTKLMKPVFSALRKKGHQIMGYLDDSFLMGDTFEECEKAVVASVELLTKLGFQIHLEKSRLLPVHVIEYLGFLIDSVTMTIRLTPLKRQKVLSIISEIISSKSLLIRDLAKLFGTLESTLPGVQFGRLHVWHLQQDKNEALRNSQGNYNSPCKLSDNSYKELKWWVENLPNCFNPIRKFLPKSVVYSDACPNGWGAAFEDQSTGGLWTPKEAELHINVLETAAAYFALKLFCKGFENTAVHLKVDNTATVAFIKNKKHLTKLFLQ